MLLKNTFTHHVHFWLKNRADRELLIEGLHTLAPIKHIRDYHVGVPAETFRDVVDRTYDVSLLLFFDDPEAQEAYQVDDIHEAFVHKYVHPLVERVVVQDSVNA
ncbi:MAG: Dabb family protein [Sphingobacteriales bacterium]|nr:MAG: Dabb family protein [Sphingobacteriales bacterium]